VVVGVRSKVEFLGSSKVEKFLPPLFRVISKKNAPK